MKARLREEHVKAMEAGGNPASEAAGRLGRSWMDRAKALGRTDGFGMHDPLAMAVFIDPSIVTLKKYYVDVETAGELTAGETVPGNKRRYESRRRPPASPNPKSDRPRSSPTPMSPSP